MYSFFIGKSIETERKSTAKVYLFKKGESILQSDERKLKRPIYSNKRILIRTSICGQQSYM